MAANEVVWYSSGDAGAPVLNNAVGSLIGVLDACLVSGYNPKPVASIVVSANVATATISAHGFFSNRVVSFTGASPTGLNGRQRVTVTGANTITFPTTGVADGAATGTITCMTPGLGWVKQFATAGKAMYRRSAPEALAALLRVDDTLSSAARVVMVESATDIDTYVNPAPSAAMIAGGSYWQKGEITAAAKRWVVVGDHLTVFVLTESQSYSYVTTGALTLRFFGDLISYRAGDGFSSMISLGSSTVDGALAAYPVGAGTDAAYEGCPITTRAANQLGASVGGIFVAPWSGSNVAAAGPMYPSGVDNGLTIASRVMFQQQAGIRGECPGLAIPLANIGNRLHGQVLTPSGSAERQYLALAHQQGSVAGCHLIDITGPWQ